MDNPDTDIRKRIAAYMGRCSVCHRQYRETDVEVRSREDDNWMMLVQCPDCRGQQVVAARFSEQPEQEDVQNQLLWFAQRELTGVFEAEPDLQLEGSTDLPPVEVNDLVDMHEFLDSFNGDFSALFSEDQ
jgi:excinuclease UvrABC ATPase subunit